MKILALLIGIGFVPFWIAGYIYEMITLFSGSFTDGRSAAKSFIKRLADSV